MKIWTSCCFLFFIWKFKYSNLPTYHAFWGEQQCTVNQGTGKLGDYHLRPEIGLNLPPTVWVLYFCCLNVSKGLLVRLSLMILTLRNAVLYPFDLQYLTGPYLPSPWRQNWFWKFGLEGRARKAGQNEAGQIKGQQKLAQLNFFCSK